MARPVHCSIRVAGEADLEGVLAIHVAQGNRHAEPASERELATWRQMMGTDGLAVYLAEADGAPAGTASTVLMPNITYDCAPTLFIEAVVVAPGYRRRGIASAILQRVLTDATEHGCDKVQLLSHKRHAHDGGHALYEKLGFRAEAEGFRRYLRSGAGRL